MDYFIAKPYEKKELIDKIVELTGREVAIQRIGS